MRWYLRPRLPVWLLGIFCLQWALWAYRPLFFQEWLLENVLPFLFVGLLIATHRRFPLSNISYLLILLFLCLHTVGSHYTYSLVPYNRWSQVFLAAGIDDLAGFERNHYDRLVHFSFGLMMAYPIREVFVRIAGVEGFWGYYLPLDLTMSFSMLYELIEWVVALVFGGDIGQAYLGTQGDVWDAHKDMALATTGAILSMSAVAFINWKYNRNFGAEMRHSIAVKDARPLGEVKLREMIEDNRNQK
jgi:putative membrane protein